MDGYHGSDDVSELSGAAGSNATTAEPLMTVAGSTVAGSTIAGSTIAGSAVAGSAVTGSAVTGSAVAGAAREERHDAARLQRIVDLIEDSLAKPNALEAHLGVLIGELLAMARMTGLAIAAALARDGETLDYGGTMQQAIHRYLKVVKQVERFSELQDRRDRDARRAPARDFGPAWPAR